MQRSPEGSGLVLRLRLWRRDGRLHPVDSIPALFDLLAIAAGNSRGSLALVAGLFTRAKSDHDYREIHLRRYRDEGVPMAGHDSMLLNLSGAHGPYFTRTLVVLYDSDGNTGVGDTPGGEQIQRTLVEARDMVVGKKVSAYNAVSQEHISGQE
jgi:hypothetical protein